MKSVIIPVLFSLALVGVLASGVSKIYNNTNDEPDTITNNRGSSGMSGDISSSTALTGDEEPPAGQAAQLPDPTLKNLIILPPPVQVVEKQGDETLITIQYSAHNVAKIREIQRLLGIEIDGRVGKATLDAIILKLGGKIPAKPAKAAPKLNVYVPSGIKPLRLPSLRELRSGKSVYGRAGHGQLVSLTPPYQLYYGDVPVKTILAHRLVADRVYAALSETLRVYGHEGIRELKLDVFAGGYCYRNSRGGSRLSPHAWGVAFDFYPAANGLRTPTSRAAFARAEYAPWIKAWERVGARNLGRVRGTDWMHFEFILRG